MQYDQQRYKKQQAPLKRRKGTEIHQDHHQQNQIAAMQKHSSLQVKAFNVKRQISH